MDFPKSINGLRIGEFFENVHACGFEDELLILDEV
jgi:hypothetical protein